MAINYVKPQPVDIKSNSELNERWVQDLIEKDTSILGLGDLDMKDRAVICTPIELMEVKDAEESA